jgi:hypothetical protein
VELAE